MPIAEIGVAPRKSEAAISPGDAGGGKKEKCIGSSSIWGTRTRGEGGGKERDRLLGLGIARARARKKKRGAATTKPAFSPTTPVAWKNRKGRTMASSPSSCAAASKGGSGRATPFPTPPRFRRRGRVCRSPTDRYSKARKEGKRKGGGPGPGSSVRLSSKKDRKKKEGGESLARLFSSYVDRGGRGGKLSSPLFFFMGEGRGGTKREGRKEQRSRRCSTRPSRKERGDARGKGAPAMAAPRGESRCFLFY